MRPRKLKVFFLDDKEMNTVFFANSIPKLNFVHSDGTPYIVETTVCNRVADAFKLPEFKDPETVAPFDIIFLDEQLHQDDYPANGPAVMQAIVDGTEACPRLRKFGELPGGYHYFDKPRFMYSTETAYKLGEEKIKAHLSKITVGDPQKEDATYIDVYSSGLITKGHRKDFINANTLLSIFKAELVDQEITVTKKTDAEIEEIEKAQARARAEREKQRKLLLKKKEQKGTPSTGRGRRKPGRGGFVGGKRQTQSTDDLSEALATASTEDVSPKTGLGLDFNTLALSASEAPAFERAVSAPLPGTGDTFHRVHSAPPGLFPPAQRPPLFSSTATISPSRLETGKITDSSPSSSGSGTPSSLSEGEEDSKAFILPKLDFPTSEPLSPTPPVTPTALLSLSDNNFFNRKGSTPKAGGGSKSQLQTVTEEQTDEREREDSSSKRTRRYSPIYITPHK